MSRAATEAAPDGGGEGDGGEVDREAARQLARIALLDACEGWRQLRRCTAPDGTRLPHPHPECLVAQYRHEVILLEHGVPR